MSQSSISKEKVDGNIMKKEKLKPNSKDSGREIRDKEGKDNKDSKEKDQKDKSKDPNKPHVIPHIPVTEQRLALFDHLISKSHAFSTAAESLEGDPAIHPAIAKAGLLFRQGVIFQDDDRVPVLLAAFMSVVEDYKAPSNKTISWDLDKYIRSQVQHIVNCRQLSVGMGNFIKFVRKEISDLAPDIKESVAKEQILNKLKQFLEEKLLYARESITRSCIESIIKDGDVLMTFGYSPLLLQTFRQAAEKMKFTLVIIDSRPLNDGLKQLDILSSSIKCVYTTLGGATFAMKNVTKVIVGASALLSNGTMLSCAGTAMLSSIAKTKNIPFVVACEGYKFSEKVQIDSIVYNELGATDEISVSGDDSSVIPQMHSGYRGNKSTNTLPFQVINLRYDITPIRNISVVVTETGLIPSTSIPVLLRELRGENNRNPEDIQEDVLDVK